METTLKKMACLVAACCTLVGVSCQSTSKPTAVANTYIGYYLRYTEDDNTLRSDATFKQGDSLAVAKPLAMQGNVSLNGQPMPLQHLDLGDYYSISGTKQQIDSNYTFSYNDVYQGKLAKQHVFFPKATNIRLDGASLSLKKGATLRWDGSPLRAREELVVEVEDAAAQSHEIHIVGPTQTSSFALASSQLEGIKSGKASISVRRMANIPLSESPHTRGSATTEYYAKQIAVQLVP